MTPIVERELRLTSRRPLTYWARSGFGTLAVVLTFWAVGLRNVGLGGTNAGIETFRMLSVIALISGAITALRLTAPSIAVEKREGTLGLLFLTDLKPHDVVFGKLAVTSLAIFYRFLAIVPVMGISILLGGVTAGDLVRLTLVMLNLMFLAAAVGLFASTLSKDEKSAAGLALLLMLLVLGLGPLAALVAFWLGLPGAIMDFLVLLSPTVACFETLNPMRGLTGFWTSLISGHVAGWLLLGWTCHLLPRVWQDRPVSAKRAGRTERMRAVADGDARTRRTRRTELLSISPILWLSARQRLARWYPWFFLAAIGALMLWITLKYDVSWRHPGLALGATWMLQAIFKLFIASQASLTFSGDRDQGALELLLSTPLTTRDLIRGHWLGLQRLFSPPLLFLVAASLTWFLWAVFSRNENMPHDPSRFLLLCTYGANLLVLCADIWAVGWLGMWMGVTSKNAHQASSRTHTRVLLLPWIACMASMSLTAFFVDPDQPFPCWLGYWFAWSVFIDVMYVRMAQRRLKTSLREMALERYAGRPGGTPRWARAVGRGVAWILRLGSRR